MVLSVAGCCWMPCLGCPVLGSGCPFHRFGCCISWNCLRHFCYCAATDPSLKLDAPPLELMHSPGWHTIATGWGVCVPHPCAKVLILPTPWCWIVLDGVRWCWMLLDGVGCCWMVLDDVRRRKKLLDGVGCCWMVLDGAEWCWMLDVSGWYWMLLGGVGWCKTVLDGAGCC